MPRHSWSTPASRWAVRTSIRTRTSTIPAGATIVTQELNRPYFQKVLANPNKLNPDCFAKSDNKAKVVGVKGRMVLTDGSRVIEPRG
jgi:hypothetical protein